jgi:hypothetical protein
MGGRSDFRTENDLAKTSAVAQIDEDHATVIAPAVYPTRQSHLFANPLGARLTAITTALPITQGVVKNALGH